MFLNFRVYEVGLCGQGALRRKREALRRRREGRRVRTLATVQGRVSGMTAAGKEQGQVCKFKKY